MKDANAMIMQTAHTLSGDFSNVFGKNMGILDTIMGPIKSIISKGASQFGLSPAEEAAERTMAMDSTAAAGKQISQAVNDAEAAKGGGNAYLPKGADAAIEEDIAARTAEQNVQEQLGITTRGYQIGRENFWDATKVAMKAPGALETPALAFGEAALSGAQDALRSNTELTSPAVHGKSLLQE
jgi:hypothetical protein